ncbi:hypothetical protein FKM82_006454 [Ascaphus truei]
MASNSTSSIKKRSRKPLTLNAKLEIIKLSEQGMCNAEIGRKLHLPRQTVSTIVHGKEKVLMEIKSATPVNTKVIRKRDNLIADMEKVLVVWIENQTSHNVPLCRAIIQAKALSLFNNMKADRGDVAADNTFEASRGWFNRFKARSQLHNISVQGEAASADTEAAQSYPRELAKVIEEGGYTKQQIFSVDETGLYWKKMPSRANAAGDCKLKPMMIYRSENPRALKNYAKASLPVYYKSKSKAWVTGILFSNWFTDYFKPTVEAYCRSKNIPFKKGFTILDGIKTIRDAWEEVKESTLKGVWRKLIPTLMNDYEDLENHMEEATTNVLEMARELDLEVETEDVKELLESHDQSLTARSKHPDNSPAVPVEMTTKGLEEAINCIEKGMAAFERIYPNFERSSKVNASLQNAIACYKEIVRERRRQSSRQLSLLSFFS